MGTIEVEAGSGRNAVGFHVRKESVMVVVNTAKNRARDKYTFANINLLGKCNVDCFFCLGKDIEEILCKQNQLKLHFSEWPRFDEFLSMCAKEGIQNIYLTGQNTDPLIYQWLEELVHHIQEAGFCCGVRTNGFLALKEGNIKALQAMSEEVGYSIHTLNPITQKMILGRADVPDWRTILNIPGIRKVRVSMVLNRCNESEFFELLRFLSEFKQVRYIQVRRISTDTREQLLMPDMAAFERVYTKVREVFPLVRRFVTDAEEYEIYGKKVDFWRTVKTSANSLNYFTDGTISDLYFIIEGYLKYHKEQ